MAEYTKREVIDAVLLEPDGTPVGALAVPADRLPRIEEAIRRAELRVRQAYEDPGRPGVYVYEPMRTEKTVQDLLDEDCSPDDSRVCELGISLVQVIANAEKAGVTQSQIDEILNAPVPEGTGRDQAVLDAEKRILSLMPAGEDKEEAQNWCSAAFSEEACGANG
jgi:hypothetical protein